MKSKTCFTIMILLLMTVLRAQEKSEVVSLQAEPQINYVLIFEGGFTTASPVSICGEFVTMQGISIHKQHFIALASGIAGGFVKQYGNSEDRAYPFYIPIYAHYRYHLKPEKTFSPIIAASLGGVITYNQRMQTTSSQNSLRGGFYSAIAAGFKAGKFFLLGGINFTPMCTTEINYRTSTDPWGYPSTSESYSYQWIYPIGICLKLGINL